jgi:2-dehydropantoate 2-reductase
MKDVGLHMATREEEFTVRVHALHLHEACLIPHQFDIVFLACKSYDSMWMTQLIEPYLKSDGILVSSQNSINDEWVAPIVGQTREIGCVVTMSSEVFEPGHLKRNTAMEHTTFTLGESHGRITPRLLELQAILNDAGKTEVTGNLWGKRWSKLTFNSITAAVCAISSAGPAIVMDDPRRVRCCLALGAETLKVGQALGYNMEPVFGLSMEEAIESPDKLVASFTNSARTEGLEARSFFQQDVLKGRKTEVDYINGLVARKGQEAGVPTPMNEEAVKIVKKLETGELVPDPENIVLFDEVLAKIG